MPELCREATVPDQYGCGNPDRTDLFLKLSFEHGDRLVIGVNPLRCLPPIDEQLEKKKKLGTVNSSVRRKPK